MNALTSLELSTSRIADSERRWLYGHPYRTAPSRRRRPGIARMRTRRAA